MNPLVDMSNAESAPNFLYSKCADFQISLKQNLQFADFFAATSYAAKRKKKWTFFGGVRAFRGGRAGLPVGCEMTSPEVGGPVMTSRAL